MSEVWEKWQDQVINGVFPLRRLLGYSDHSGVFLTEFTVRDLPDAALKLVPDDGPEADTRLALWKEAAALSHPHLIQLLEAGRCELEGLPFIFVVMDYAEQTLAQILPQRALTPDEVKEMLRPTLAGLGYLHRRHWVQGALKPSNILVVADQLKLASDTMRASGEAADDVWGLGLTMVEALTQHPPAWVNESFDPGGLPAAIPESLAHVVRQCLSRNPADRPTVADLESQLQPVLPAMAPEAMAPEAMAPQSPVRQEPTRHVPAWWSKQRILAAALVAVLVVSLMVWAGFRGGHPAPPAAPAPPSAPAPVRAADAVPPASPVGSRPSDQAATLPAKDSRAVLHEEIPDVSRGTRDTIRGRIKVAVRVTVDSAGDVTRAVLEKPGTSKYFDRVAVQAAGRWKFAPAEHQEPRQWLLRFEFARSGTAAHAGAIQPQP
jgi:TonB family protein